MSTLPGGTLAELTRAAVVRASALTGQRAPAPSPRPVAAGALATLLYRSGGCVPDPRRDARWASQVVTAAVRQAGAALGGHDHSRTEHWQSWTHPAADPALLVHKIYVSPFVADLADVLVVLLAEAPLLGVPAWKVGADLAGLHRPDKIVLYLPDAERADEVAAALARSLSGARAQGVPFTGQVGRTGLVSRGRDVAGTSWRAQVCRRVADALLDTRAALGPAAPAVLVADGALASVARSGLDVQTWHPTLASRPRPRRLEVVCS